MTISTATVRERHAQHVTEAGGVAERETVRNAEFDEWFDSLRCPSISPSDQRCIGMAEPWHEGHIDRHCSTWRDYAAKVPGLSGLARSQSQGSGDHA